MMKSRTIMLAAVALILTSGTALAARNADAPQADCEGLRVATGPLGKGYSKLFADVKKVTRGSVSLCEVNTEGGLDNLTTLSTKGADVGIVPIDALAQLAPGDANIQALQVVATLNSNYLHIIANARGVTYAGAKKYMGLSSDPDKTVRVTSFSQLRGQRVAAVGSAQLLVRQINKQLGYNMIIQDVANDDQAYKLVQAGQVLASFSVAGWPHGSVSRLKQDSNLTLIPFDAPIGSPYNVRPYTYKNLGVYNVQALSVQNVLVTRPFSGAAKINDVANLKSAIANNLDDLKDGNFEPGWNEIRSLDSNVEWAKFNGGGSVAKRK
jgi:TRAP-type uncharacterized transport system substrate-binding protein